MGRFSREEREILQKDSYECVKSGMSYIDISKRHGVSRQTVYDWLKDFPPIKGECAYCHRKFTKISTNRMYCSSSCSDKAFYRKRKEEKRKINLTHI